MSKKKLLVMILALGTILVFGAVVSAIDEGYAADEEICGEFGLLVGNGDAASWLTDETPRTPGENLTAMGIYSPRLDKGTGGAASTYVQFTPGFETVTIADLEIADINWGFWYFLEDTASPPGPHLELRFENPAAAGGWVDITIMAAQAGSSTLDVWTEVSITQATVTVMSGGLGALGEDLWYCVAGKTLAEVLAYLEAQDGTWSADTWVLTRVRLELWEAGARTCYVDDIKIKGHVYDLEPCGINLYPDLAKNVKTADETFTVVDGNGFEIDGNTVSNWIVTKGQGIGDVITDPATGPAAADNFIIVRMITMGDCIITCDVVSGNYEVTLHAEKKWGEIYYTELTAWDDADIHCEPRPYNTDSEISRSGIEVDEEVLVQEKVFANFLPGPVSAPAGGAKITWWLLENNATSQAAIEALVAKFDNWFVDPDADLGYGHGCGQYGTWAGDPTFIPETIIEGIYTAHPALFTEFVKEECVDTPDVTKTETITDHVWEPLGEGFTNTTVKFFDVGSGTVEPVILVVLADYPLDKNGQNAVCVEYFKFNPTPEYKDVQTLVVDVIDLATGEIDPIRKMLYVFVRDYDGTPANPESVEFDIDGPYGLFEELLADTDITETDCPGGACYPLLDPGISNNGKSAVSTTRLGTSTEKTDFGGIVDMVYTPDFVAATPCVSSLGTGYAIAGVKILSSFRECVDILIRIHDCHGCEEVIIIRDVMVCFGAPDLAVNTYDDGAGWYAMSVPLDPADDTPAAVYDELGAGVEIYGAWPYAAPYTPAIAVHEEKGTWVYLSGTTTITVEGAEVTIPTDFVFEDRGWYMISAPYTADWGDADFTAGAESAFQNDGTDRVIIWNIGVNGAYTPYYSDTSYVLDPWKGYWLLVKNTTGATLTLTKTSAPAPEGLGVTPMGRSVEGLARPPAPPTALEGAGISVELAMSSSGVSFVASGPVTSLKAKVFALDGGLVAEQTADGNELVWSMQSAAGEPVANGVYLVNVSAMNQAGCWIDLGLFRVLVLR